MQGAASVFNTKSTTPFQDKDKEEIMAQIDKYDATMLSYLARLYEAMNGEKMDFTKIKTAVDALASYNKKAEYNYLNNLLYPEKCKGVKIPSPIPVPSCSFQLHNCVTLSTNNSGNLAFVFNPFFLANENDNDFNGEIIQGDSPYALHKVNFFSTLYVNNNDTLNGHELNNNFDPINIGQTIPNVYDQYRLVSASVVVKYIGRLDITSGVIGGAIMYEDSKNVGSSVQYNILSDPDTDRTILSHNQDLAKFGNFDLAMDSFYHQENMVLEGIRELYFPLDNSYEEYTQLLGVSKAEWAPNGNRLVVNDTDAYKSGFNFFVYVLGAPANSACFKVDIYCNFECLPNASFLNYLPLSMNAGTITNTEKKTAISIVQQKPIMSMKEKGSAMVNKPSIWDKMKNKFANSLPGIGKLLSWGLGTMIPGLKPGLALAGSLIGMDSSSGNQVMEEEVE